MFEMLSSASRIVFIMIALTACTGFLWGILSVEQFMTLAVMVFAFYYTKPVDKLGDSPIK